MIIDNIKLIDGSIENAVVEQGIALPITDLESGRIFYLTQDQGPNALGLYIYSGAEWVLFSSSEYVDSRIAELIGTAPETLNSLSELATALGDDPNFILTINTKVDNEETRALAAEAQVASDLTAETTRALAAEAVVQAAVDSEESTRVASDANLQGQITAEVSARTSDVASLQSQVDSNLSTGNSANATKVSKAGDTMTGALTLPSLLPTGDNDAIPKKMLDTAVSTLEGADLTEQSARVSADNALDVRITSEVSDRQAAIVTVQTTVTDEVTRATAAEAANTVKIDTEIADRASSDVTLQGSITDEINRAQTAEAGLQAAINGITGVGGSADGEEAARIAGDASLQGQLDIDIAALNAEIADRTNSDNTLQGQITAINNTDFLRADIDDSLSVGASLSIPKAPTLDFHATNKLYVDNTIDAVIGAAPGALDTLNELATALANDPNFATTITNQIAAEESARIAADNSIQAAVDAVEADYVRRFTATVTGSYTVSAAQQGKNVHHNLFVDTSAAARTVTLPSNPETGCTVTCVDVESTFGTNALTIARNGKLIMGFADDMAVTTTNASVTLIFSGNANGWRLVY